MEFAENFRGLLARTAYCPLSLQTIMERSFPDTTLGTQQFVEVFSLNRFLLYTCICSTCTRNQKAYTNTVVPPIKDTLFQ